MSLHFPNGEGRTCSALRGPRRPSYRSRLARCSAPWREYRGAGLNGEPPAEVRVLTPEPRKAALRGKEDFAGGITHLEMRSLRDPRWTPDKRRQRSDVGRRHDHSTGAPAATRRGRGREEDPPQQEPGWDASGAPAQRTEAAVPATRPGSRDGSRRKLIRREMNIRNEHGAICSGTLRLALRSRLVCPAATYRLAPTAPESTVSKQKLLESSAGRRLTQNRMCALARSSSGRPAGAPRGAQTPCPHSTPHTVSPPRQAQGHQKAALCFDSGGRTHVGLSPAGASAPHADPRAPRGGWWWVLRGEVNGPSAH